MHIYGKSKLFIIILFDTVSFTLYIVNSMNDNLAHNITDFLAFQTARLQDLIQQISKCCDDRKLFESQKFFLPYAEIKCLMLFNEGRYLTVKSIAVGMDVAKSRASKLVNHLEEKGFIHSIDDPKDARIKLISLTQTGKAKLKEIDAFHQDIHRKILVQLSDEEKKNVLTYLELLRSAMEAVKDTFV